MSKNKTKKNSTKQKLLHAAMVAIMLVPLLVTGVQNIGMKTIHAVPRETVNLVVTKFVYGDIPETKINNGGERIAETPTGAQPQKDVPFMLFQVRDSMSAPLWSAINKYIQNYQPGGFVDISKNVSGDAEKEAAAKNEITNAEWETSLDGRTFDGALQIAYTAAGLGSLYPANTAKNLVKYPDSPWELSTIILVLFNNIVSSSTLADKPLANITASHVSAPNGNKTDEDGRLTFSAIDNIDQSPLRSRYILIEDPAFGNGDMLATEKPMVIDLPYTNVPDNTENIYVYPKNVLPMKDAEFRKVDMSSAGGPVENAVGSEDDLFSGATLDAGEIVPLAGAKFALFEYKGSNWDDFKRTKLTATKNGDEWSISESPNSVYLPNKNAGGDLVNDGVYTSNERGMVKSPMLPLGKYYFAEVATPNEEIKFTLNRYPVTFEVSAGEIAIAGEHPIHAVSYASELDGIVNGNEPDNPRNWQFPNYDVPSLTKSLDVGGNNVSNGAGGVVQGNPDFTYHLKTDLSSVDAFLDRYIAFYDIFTKASQTVGDDGYFEYPTYPQSQEDDADFPEEDGAIDDYLASLDAGNYFDSLIDIREIFDIESGAPSSAYHFWDNETADSVQPNNVIGTTPITGGVKSTLTLYDDDKKPLVYFGEKQGDNNSTNIAKYGIYIGGFDAMDDDNKVGQIGWYDVKRGSSNTWVETGTKTGTQMYWSINAVAMFNLIKSNADVQDEYEGIASNEESLVNFKDLIATVGLDFTMKPKLVEGESALSMAAVQALHNIGQFEWNNETDDPDAEPPYVEDKFDAYVGGQVFTKLSDEGTPLFTDEDAETVNGGHFVISRVNRDGEREYLKYDKELGTVDSWISDSMEDWREKVTWFDTTEATNGKFKVYGLMPNASYGNNGSIVPNNTPTYHYFVDELEPLEINGESYETMPQQEFWVAPVATTNVMPEDATLTETSLGETTMTNFKERRFPITGGVGIVAFVLLGLALTLIGVKYFKKRKLQENE